jgi:hypothetical protein
MKIETYQITVGQMKGLIGHYEPLPKASLEPLIRAAKLSQPLFTAFYGKEWLGVCGLVPPTMFAERAHLWFHHTQALSKHKLVVGRYSRWVIGQCLKAYPTVFGVCVDHKSRLWLNWLGADFTSATEFEFRRT